MVKINSRYLHILGLYIKKTSQVLVDTIHYMLHRSKEDSDIFNRFVLIRYDFIQTWKGFVYHMTCRGSRFKDGAKRNPDGQVFMKNRETDEWLKQNQRSTRNFIRKWGHFVKHDE